MNPSPTQRPQSDVTVQIKYMVAVRDRTGRNQEQIALPKGSTLRDLADRLNERYALSLPNPRVMATLNGKGWEQFPSKLATKLADGDVVYLFSLLAGG